MAQLETIGCWMLDVRCWMFSFGSRIFRGILSMTPGNIEHRTSNIQHPTGNQWPNWKPLVVGCWMLGVGCFPSVQGLNARIFRGILSMTPGNIGHRTCNTQSAITAPIRNTWLSAGGSGLLTDGD